jgi:hypothetical protein
VALAAVAVGCPAAPAAPDERPPALVAVPRPAARSGVKVPLPDGWSAQVGPDGALRAGPPGHAVLRIEPRPGAGADLPTAQDLARALEGALRESKLNVVSTKNETDYSILVYLLTPIGRSDASAAGEAPGMLGAKRIGKDLYGCSSIPGASDDEADQAALSCAGLSVPAE